MEIRALREDDDRTSFRSGDADLDRYLHQFAGQNQFRHHLGVTYGAVEDRAILGFAAVAAAHVEIDDLPVTRLALGVTGSSGMHLDLEQRGPEEVQQLGVLRIDRH